VGNVDLFMARVLYANDICSYWGKHWLGIFSLWKTS